MFRSFRFDIFADHSSRRSNVRIGRRLSIACLALGMLGFAACEQPCSTLADMVCLTRGGGSSECSELKSFAEHAGVAERHYCQSALSVIKSLKKDADRRYAH